MVERDVVTPLMLDPVLRYNVIRDVFIGEQSKVDELISPIRDLLKSKTSKLLE